jgi:hypothetical protein
MGGLFLLGRLTFNCLHHNGVGGIVKRLPLAQDLLVLM